MGSKHILTYTGLKELEEELQDLTITEVEQNNFGFHNVSIEVEEEEVDE